MSLLLKLPNELVLKIFKDLDKTNLITLAKSCRDLNIFVTEYYLSRYHKHMVPSDDIHLCERDFDVLPLLRIAIQLTSSESIRAYFTTEGCLNEMRGVEGLVAKLSSVKSVRIHLSLVGGLYGPEDEARFVKAIHGLLTTIIARSCEILFIGYGPRLRRPHHTSRQKAQRIVSNLSRGFVTPLQRILRKISVTENIADISPIDNFPTSKLTTLRIHSGLLLDRSFFHWTIHLINASPITSLELGRSQPVATCHWDGLLSAIHSGTLSEFFIQDDCHQIPLASVLAFLSRHQTITSIECRGVFRDEPQGPKFFLPQLTKLIAPCESAVRLLKDITAFPSLSDISFLDSSSCYNPIDPRTMTDALKSVGRCPNEVTLHFKFRKTDNALLAWLDGGANDDSRIERLLHQVVGLELGGEAFCSPDRTVLPVPSKWLSLFPALRLVIFQYYQPNKAAIRLNVARSIIQACPRLETLKINEETHTVAPWLAMED